jgi:hypothetical protein
MDKCVMYFQYENCISAWCGFSMGNGKLYDVILLGEMDNCVICFAMRNG